ncbi:MAG TPA: hypothetical protein DCR21_07360 [Succinivibrionaceae bacterium]|nr:hypothetical protein [Succinivibrionaceae bacterium]
MQYLLKVTLKDAELWRLLAVDGRADLAFLGELMALAFGYPKGERSFEYGGKLYKAGISGQLQSKAEVLTFDSLNIEAEEEFTYYVGAGETLPHKVSVMKKVDKLDCLMPSCLFGSGSLPEGDLTLKSIKEHLDSIEENRLDMREATTRMRTYGSFRTGSEDIMSLAGADPISFKVQ